MKIVLTEFSAIVAVTLAQCMPGRVDRLQVMGKKGGRLFIPTDHRQTSDWPTGAAHRPDKPRIPPICPSIGRRRVSGHG